MLFPEVSGQVVTVLSTISFSAQTVNLYKKLLEKIFEKEDLNRRYEIQRVKKEIEKADSRRSNLQDLILDGSISPRKSCNHPLYDTYTGFVQDCQGLTRI
jgi:hypothetical protein